MNDFKLVPLKKCINKSVYLMYQDISKKELGSINILNGVSFEEFKKICENYIKEEKIINKELNTTTNRYILFKKNIPIGEVGIRTTLNDYWINFGSQIFYKIRMSKRGLGYGNKILALALDEASILGFDKVRINASDDNIKSIKIILKNGGKKDILNYKTKDGTSTSYIIKLKDKS